MKRNLRKIPPALLSKLAAMKSNEVVAGCALKLKADTLAAGELTHLGIVLTSAGLHVPSSALPPANQGRFSARNIDGVEIVRRDLPKETRYHQIEAPNWGDSWKGTHTVDIPHEEYPREFVPPRELEISMVCNDPQPGLSVYLIAFKVDEVMDRTTSDFDSRLYDNLNLLQENIGSCGIEPADTPLSQYLKSLYVSWEILPPGTREEVIERIFVGRSASTEEKKVAGERHDFFRSLKSKSFVFGSSGFRRYFGALLEDDLVVFENILYGNAIYVLFDHWEELSKRSRIELLSGKYGTDFQRVPHTGEWRDKVRVIVAARRAEKKAHK